MPQVEPFRVEVEGTPFTVRFETVHDGMPYYEMVERPGELFAVSRCKRLPAPLPKTPVTEAQMRIMLTAVEHGFRECERGKNLQGALASVGEMYEVKS